MGLDYLKQKGILELSCVPRRCADCPLNCSVGGGQPFCYFTLREISDNEYYNTKPASCPIKPLSDIGKSAIAVGKWEPVVNAMGELVEFLCDCGCGQTAAHNYCPNCGKEMDNSDIEKRIAIATADALK